MTRDGKTGSVGRHSECLSHSASQLRALLIAVGVPLCRSTGRPRTTPCSGSPNNINSLYLRGDLIVIPSLTHRPIAATSLASPNFSSFVKVMTQNPCPPAGRLTSQNFHSGLAYRYDSFVSSSSACTQSTWLRTRLQRPHFESVTAPCKASRLW